MTPTVSTKNREKRMKTFDSRDGLRKQLKITYN